MFSNSERYSSLTFISRLGLRPTLHLAQPILAKLNLSLNFYSYLSQISKDIRRCQWHFRCLPNSTLTAQRMRMHFDIYLNKYRLRLYFFRYNKSHLTPEFLTVFNKLIFQMKTRRPITFTWSFFPFFLFLSHSIDRTTTRYSNCMWSVKRETFSSFVGKIVDLGKEKLMGGADPIREAGLIENFYDQFRY